MPIPARLTDAARMRLSMWAHVHYNQLKGEELRELEMEMLSYFRSTGKGRKDWEATYRNWVIKHVRMSKPCRHCGVRPYEKPGTVPKRDPLMGSKGEGQLFDGFKGEPTPTAEQRERAASEARKLRQHLRMVR